MINICHIIICSLSKKLRTIYKVLHLSDVSSQVDLVMQFWQVKGLWVLRALGKREVRHLPIICRFPGSLERLLTSPSTK